jgi:WD40 repeat protein
MDSELLEETPAASKGGSGGVGEVKVGWNSTGTVLSTAGDDGKIRLWKCTSSLLVR